MPIWALLGLAGVGGYLLMSKNASASSAPNPAAYPSGGWSATTVPTQAVASPNPAAYQPWSSTTNPGQTAPPGGFPEGAQVVDPGTQFSQPSGVNDPNWTPPQPGDVISAAGMVGADLAPDARAVPHKWYPPGRQIRRPRGGGSVPAPGGPFGPPPGVLPPPPVGSGPPLTVTPPAIPGVFFDTTVWAWLAWGPTPPSGAPQSGGGSWVLVTSLGPDAAAALYPDSGSGVLYSPFALPVWVWYPPADGGLYGIGTSGDTSSFEEMPAMWSGTEWTWTWKPGADIPVSNSASPPPAGGYPGSDSWIEVFPNYWVLGVLLAAEKAAAPTPPVSLTPPAPSASIRRHAPRPARFDPMSGRTY